MSRRTLRTRTTAGALAAAASLLVASCGSSQPTRTNTAAVTASVSAPRTGATSPEPPRGSGAPTDQQDLDSRLIAAAWANDVPAVGPLIAAGADVNAKDTTGQSAFLIAAGEGRLPLLDVMLENGADVASLDSWGGTGLIRAAQRGYAGIVGRLIRAAIDPDHVNSLGWTGLHEALIFARPDQPQAYIDTVRVLVAAGADVATGSRNDELSPVQLAEQHGLSAQAAILRAATETQPIGQQDADRRLLDAARTGDADAAALALRAGAELEARTSLQQTPLLLASANDSVDVARLLVALGADPDALDHQHDTPWLVTGVTGSVAMLEALLPAQPDLTIENRFGGLSPIPAGERGHADYIQRVVLTGVDLDHVNDPGWTALLEAVVYGDGSMPYQRIVTTLVAAGAATSIKDRNGMTALDHARAQGYTAIVAILQDS